jgi:hypothetical protein
VSLNQTVTLSYLSSVSLFQVGYVRKVSLALISSHSSLSHTGFLGKIMLKKLSVHSPLNVVELIRSSNIRTSRDGGEHID